MDVQFLNRKDEHPQSGYSGRISRYIALFMAIPVLLLLLTSPLLAVDVTINRDNLSEPNSSNASVYLRTGGIGTRILSTQTLTLTDGSYSLETLNGYSYGDFSVVNDQVTGVTGSLVYDPLTSVMSFDTSLLARVTIHFSEIDQGLNQILFGIRYVSGEIRSTSTFYFPDGDYEIGFRGAGTSFGTMYIRNGAITLDGYLIFGAGGDVHFDLNALPRITITRGDELNSLAAIHEVGGLNGIRTGNYTLYMTPGSYAVITRGTYAPYGFINVADDNSVSSTDLLITDTTTNTVSFDIEHTPILTFLWGQLSDTETGGNILHGAVFENIASPNDYTVLLPLDSSFPVIVTGGAKLGDVSIDSTGIVDVTGHMLIESEIVDQSNRIHTTIGFELCAMNTVALTPTNGIRYWFHLHATTAVAATTYLPNGSYSVFGDSGARISFDVDSGGIIVTDDNFADLIIELIPSDCEPPDSDSDSVIDDLDICPGTSTNARVDEHGCSVQQSIDAECSIWQSKNHGKFVSCVTRVVNEAAESGLIENNAKGEVIRAAAQSR